MARTTENYGLTMPLETDFYDIADFNHNAALVDAALEALQRQLDITGCVAGTYTGNATTSGNTTSGSQSIELGFAPRAVLVIPNGTGVFYSGGGNSYTYGGLAVEGNDLGASSSNGGYKVLELTDTGFRVSTYAATGGVGVGSWAAANNSGTRYHYVACK